MFEMCRTGIAVISFDHSLLYCLDALALDSDLDLGCEDQDEREPKLTDRTVGGCKWSKACNSLESFHRSTSLDDAMGLTTVSSAGLTCTSLASGTLTMLSCVLSW